MVSSCGGGGEKDHRVDEVECGTVRTSKKGGKRGGWCGSEKEKGGMCACVREKNGVVG